ncbi:uracil-DNA glycosylase family protein [Hathewaya massiliensis]|uniref:uracil-DNA glycosylase family protein n=1 Tax=Hathewaya massiliensis TaxID=1964382 RepID=UPI00163C5783|nr:uracil-DNA glycosylase family protein [Hathewaya massiliensis]
MEIMQGNLSIDKYLKYNLDILFVALNPPKQSNSNGHYFSGKQSTFFKLLYESGLVTVEVDKLNADEQVFGGTEFNYKNKQFGIIDVVAERVETSSKKVKVSEEHIKSLIGKIIEYKPKTVCIIHSKIKNKFNRVNDFRKLEDINDYGNYGKLLKECNSVFFMQYFPNGNSISKEMKLKIFGEIRESL